MVRFTDDNVRKVMVPLLDKIGLHIEGVAKILCPVDTGRLHGSIQHKVVSDDSVVIGTNVPYAKYVEFMHPLASPKPGRETGQMPFLRPAIFQSKPEVQKMIREFFRR